MTQLSPHFTLEELTFSETALRKGLDNAPTAQARTNLVRLATTVLEPVRDLLGVPLHINSGYRAPKVNASVGGAANSMHVQGLAADIVPVGLPLRAAFDRIRASAIAYDQIIIECNAWIHIGLAASGAQVRREALAASGGPGHWSYSRVA